MRTLLIAATAAATVACSATGGGGTEDAARQGTPAPREWIEGAETEEGRRGMARAFQQYDVPPVSPVTAYPSVTEELSGISAHSAVLGGVTRYS